MTIARFPVPPIIKTVTVRAAPGRAFALFADDFARWWPLARTHTGPDPVRLRDRAAGRWAGLRTGGRWARNAMGNCARVRPAASSRLFLDCRTAGRDGTTGRDPLYRRGPRHQGRADAFGLGTTR